MLTDLMKEEKPKRAGLRRDKQLQVYAELVKLYPDKEAYLKQYAELLLAEKKIATATETLRHLHHLLLDRGDSSAADALAKQFPIIGRIRAKAADHEDIQSLLPNSMRNRLRMKLSRKRLREGQYLLHHGEKGDTCFLVCEGELAEFGRCANGHPLMLNLAAAGDLICEEKLLKPGIHKTDVVANKESIVIKLSRKRMTTAMIADPALKVALKRRAEFHHLIALISLSPVLQSIPLKLRRHLAGESFISNYAAGALIHKSGEKLDHVDLIVHGEAVYQMQGHELVKELKVLKPGALIGETAAVRDSGCPADMVTHHGVDIIHIPYAVFVNVVEAYPPLRKSLTDYAAEQRARLMSRLNELQTIEMDARNHRG